MHYRWNVSALKSSNKRQQLLAVWPCAGRNAWMHVTVECEVNYLLVTIPSWSSLQRISGLDATRMDPSACRYTMYGEGFTTRNAL